MKYCYAKREIEEYLTYHNFKIFQLKYNLKV